MDQDTQVKRWDTKTGQEFSFEAHETNIKALFISLDNTKLITIAFDGIIKSVGYGKLVVIAYV